MIDLISTGSVKEKVVTFFTRFASADLSERFKKKKLKSLIPQIVQVIYLGSLSVFSVGAVTLAGSYLSSDVVIYLKENNGGGSGSE
ncbi:hypothetical protein F2Q69_00060092 [Brassica cretica]|uniref:Uncharacterized protein n=1 Tax=Brassica cretica TaxID=69181 RepID=A0A8S9RHR8_BRACR|nr:hypothetical protein F2Q69_00060092 [Brassica cretica]